MKSNKRTSNRIDLTRKKDRGKTAEYNDIIQIIEGKSRKNINESRRRIIKTDTFTDGLNLSTGAARSIDNLLILLSGGGGGLLADNNGLPVLSKRSDACHLRWVVFWPAMCVDICGQVLNNKDRGNDQCFEEREAFLGYHGATLIF